jgi:glucose-6-phosphate 1-epimerase
MLQDYNLTAQKELTSNVTLATNASGIAYLLIQNEHADAAISLFGAHLMHYQAKDKQPLLWMSNSTAKDGSKPFRGGVPVCWPWFGPSPTDVGLGKPAHGFARIMTWNIEGVSELAEGTLIHLSLESSAETLAMWPHAFHLEFEVLVGKELTMSLTTENTGETDLQYRSALHSYFIALKPEAITISGLGASYIDKLANAEVKTQSGDYLLTGAVDSIYTAPENSVTFTNGYNTVQMDNGNANSVVIWNPWEQGAANMADFDSDRWPTMICIETALTGEGVIVEAGEEHTLSATLRYLA